MLRTRHPGAARVRRGQVLSPANTRSSSSTRTATRSASAASCTTTACRSTRSPTASSRRRSPPRTAASSSTGASTSSAPRAPCSPTCRPTRWCRAAPPSRSRWPRTCSCRPSAPCSARSRRRSSRCCSRAGSSKREILKLYFDRAYMGGGAFGVEAASQYYFGKSVREINLAEVGDARGPVQGADQVRASRQPAGLARPHQRRSQQPRRGRVLHCGPGARRAHQPGEDHRDAQPQQPRLVPRLGLRGGAAPRGGPRPVRADRAHDDRPQHAESDGRSSGHGTETVPRQPHHQRRHRAVGDRRRGAKR